MLWDFGDGESSNLQNPNHTYNNPGEYTVKVKINTGYNIINLIKNIIIYQSPIANKAEDYILCDDLTNNGFEPFELIDKTSEILGTQLDSEFYVSYFESYDDAANNVDALPITYINKRTNQEIYVRIQNRLNTVCYDISSFSLIVETKIAGVVEDYIICDDISNDGKEIIDLSQFDAQVSSLAPVKPHTDCKITYHLTEAEATLGIVALPNNYETESNNQDIYVRFENINTGCFDTKQIKIIINKVLTAHRPSDMYLCDDSSNDGKEVFDLASQKAAILKTQTGRVTFHATQPDADSGRFPLDENFENQLQSQEIFVRVENWENASCYDTTSFKIKVMFQPIAGTVSDYVI